MRLREWIGRPRPGPLPYILISLKCSQKPGSWQVSSSADGYDIVLYDQMLILFMNATLSHCGKPLNGSNLILTLSIDFIQVCMNMFNVSHGSNIDLEAFPSLQKL